MTFRELLGGMSGQRVLVNANGVDSKFAVGEFVTITYDFLSIRFNSEAVHYPISRVLEVRTACDSACYVLADQNGRVEVHTDEEPQGQNAIVFIRLTEPD